MMISAAVSILATASYSNSIVESINELRARHGYRPVIESKSLSDYCMIYASLMVRADHVSHDLIEKRYKRDIIYARAEQHGESFKNLRVFECLYRGPHYYYGITNRDLSLVWLRSRDHTAIILYPEAEYIGVGYWFSGRYVYLCIVMAWR